MAIVAADWTVTRSNGNIRYIGADHGAVGASYATTIEFHRWLQDLADDPVSSGDDALDATDILPSSRATDNLITLLGLYNIDDGAAEHLYDGTIIQGTGGTEVYYDGIVNYGNSGIVIGVHQNGAVLADDFWNWGVGGADDTSAGASFMTDSGEAWTIDQWVGYVIKNLTDGSQALITSNTATTILGTLWGGTNDDWDSGDNYLISQGLNEDVTQGISHRFLIKTRTAGADIDNRKLLGINRTLLKTFGEFSINATARGNNVLALSDAGDLNNTTAVDTIGGWIDVYMDRVASSTTVSGVNSAGQPILNVVDGTQFLPGDFIQPGVASDIAEYQILSIATNALTLNRNLEVATVGGETVYDLSYGFNQIDVDNDSTNEDYYCQWDKGAKSINQFFERMKWLGMENGPGYLFGIPGELFRGITHEIDVDTPTGTWAPCEDISWSGGTGQMLAVDSPTAATKLWMQILTGVAPTDGQVITGGISAASAAMNVTIVDRSSLISTPFVGTSTGSALIGSYGLTLQTTDLSAADKIFDLTNTLIAPPNNVQFDLSGLVIGEDYVIVGPWDGTSTDINGDPEVNYNQMALNVSLSVDNITSVTIGHANGDELTIPTDTPSTGFIRVEDDNGFLRKLHYTGFTGTVFTIDTTDGQEDFLSVNATLGNNVFLTYLDKLAGAIEESFTFVYNVDRKFVIKVRDGGGTPIKEYITSGTMGSNGGSSTAIRTTDT